MTLPRAGEARRGCGHTSRPFSAPAVLLAGPQHSSLFFDPDGPAVVDLGSSRKLLVMPAHNAAGQNRNMVSRSNSLLGTIKNILPAKLPWFGASSDQADTPSKRKQEEERLDVEEGTRSNKRQRVNEELGELGEIRRVPDAAQPRLQPSAAGYLDPPQRLLGEATTVNVPRASPLHTRASSVAAPSRSTRRTGMSPALGGPRYQTMRIMISRTQSMDPPKRYRSASYKPVLSPMPISRDASMEDLSFEDSPPSPAKPFRMRTSLTPQLPDLDISGGRNERDGSEPPLVDELVDKPVFVRAPSEAPRQATPLARSGSLTLGAVVEARKQVRHNQILGLSMYLSSLCRPSRSSDPIARS